MQHNHKLTAQSIFILWRSSLYNFIIILQRKNRKITSSPLLNPVTTKTNELMGMAQRRGQQQRPKTHILYMRFNNAQLRDCSQVTTAVNQNTTVCAATLPTCFFIHHHRHGSRLSGSRDIIIHVQNHVSLTPESRVSAAAAAAAVLLAARRFSVLPSPT